MAPDLKQFTEKTRWFHNCNYNKLSSIALPYVKIGRMALMWESKQEAIQKEGDEVELVIREVSLSIATSSELLNKSTTYEVQPYVTVYAGHEVFTTLPQLGWKQRCTLNSVQQPINLLFASKFMTKGTTKERLGLL